MNKHEVSMIEKELKVLLTQAQYRKLHQAFCWEHVIEQTNHYYLDFPGVIKAHHITVRVRETAGTNKLQIKYPVQDTGISFSEALVIRAEHKENIEGLPEVLEGGRIARITGVSCDNLYLVGSLLTRRHIFRCDQTIVCLDQNHYMAVEDYELEIEFSDLINEALIAHLCNMGINFNQKAIGKFTRFMAEYNRK
jgi:uncharacterized protein YjbK